MAGNATTGESPKRQLTYDKAVRRSMIGLLMELMHFGPSPVASTIGLDQSFRFSFPFTPVLAKRFNTALASIAIDPGAPEHAPDNIDAVKDIGRRHNRCLNSHAGERIAPRFAAGKFSMHDVVRKVVLSVFVSAGNPLFVEHLSPTPDAS
jgi:hypothetical protein